MSFAMAFLGSLLLFLTVSAGCTLPEVRTAQKLAAQGHWDEAVAAYRTAVRKDPFNKDIQKAYDEAKARAAERHYAAGREFLKENRILEALEEFRRALGLDPSRSEHHAALGDAMRLKEAREKLQAAEKLRSLGRLEDALDAYERAVELDPSLTKALEGITAIAQQQRAAKLVGLSGQPITLRFQNARLKEVFEIFARAGNINVIFDKEVKDDPITIFIKDTPFDEALNLILSSNGLFSRRIGPDMLLIIPNTKPKQDQYQDLMIRTFYLSNAKAKETVNLLRTMLESKRVYVNEQLNAVVIRDTPTKLQLAERIILANDRREAEVEFDMEVLEVNRTKSQQYGVNFAKAAGFGVVPPEFKGPFTSANVTAQQSYNLDKIETLGKAATSQYLFSFPANLLLDFFKSETDAKTLANPKLRVINNKQASVNIGDKQPILLSTTNVLPGQAATGAVPTTSTVTSIEFKDVGLKLTVEPTIHLVDEITLKLKIEVTTVGEQVVLQANPEIRQFKFGTRTAETTLNMKDDETVVLAGLIQDVERKTRVSVPGLGDIPILGNLFATNEIRTETTEIVLTITPHMIRNLTTPSLETQAFWSGTEASYATNPLFSQQVTTVSQPPSAPVKPLAPAPGPAAPSAPSPQAPPAPAAPGLSQPVPPTPDIVARGPAVLGFLPVEAAVAVGQEVRLDLTANNLESLTDSVMTIAFDPQVLEFRQVLEGEFLKRDGVTSAATLSATPAAGQVELRLRRQGPPASGSGVLATLVFQAKKAGASPVVIQKSMVSGAGGKVVPVKPEIGLIRVK